MKIGPNANPTALNTSSSVNNMTTKTKQSQATAEVTTLASVSKQARELESMQQELRNLPDVDLERVNQIRSELKQGSFVIDLDELASAIFDTHHND
ncbi:flagellar biosynthesis anti-sigma factor FlgM [Vibrio sp.]|uniref:flagellar biosynthesis anti-sigma factor FlgM n=1 Tax=Vibrio sp. TaxID=678 RepID=UPI00287271CD|nr:flagellar biosynthesis anti-sigma factor FlgM [Vibrio sp. FNV 38]